MLVYRSEDSTKRYQKTMLGVRAEDISGESTDGWTLRSSKKRHQLTWLAGKLPISMGIFPTIIPKNPMKIPDITSQNHPMTLSHQKIPWRNPWHLHILHGDLSPDLVMRGDLEADGLHVGSMGPLAQWSMVTESPLVAGWNGGVKSPSFTHLTH